MCSDFETIFTAANIERIALMTTPAIDKINNATDTKEHLEYCRGDKAHVVSSNAKATQEETIQKSLLLRLAAIITSGICPPFHTNTFCLIAQAMITFTIHCACYTHTTQSHHSATYKRKEKDCRKKKEKEKK